MEVDQSEKVFIYEERKEAETEEEEGSTQIMGDLKFDRKRTEDAEMAGDIQLNRL